MVGLRIGEKVVLEGWRLRLRRCLQYGPWMNSIVIVQLHSEGTFDDG
jgi:hypothetical protein